MPSVINKPFLNHNLKYGLKSECKILPAIKHHFDNSLKPSPDPYSNFDFIGDNIMVELKTRRGNHIQKRYSTFPFDACKLNKYKMLKKQNPKLQAYVCWYWKDMNKLHYWKIHDNETQDDEEVDHYIKKIHNVFYSKNKLKIKSSGTLYLSNLFVPPPTFLETSVLCFFSPTE